MWRDARREASSSAHVIGAPSVGTAFAGAAIDTAASPAPMGLDAAASRTKRAESTGMNAPGWRKSETHARGAGFDVGAART